MRHRVSVTLEQDTVLGLIGMLRDPRFGNRSQIVEFALKRLFEEAENADKQT